MLHNESISNSLLCIIALSFLSLSASEENIPFHDHLQMSLSVILDQSRPIMYDLRGDGKVKEYVPVRVIEDSVIHNKNTNKELRHTVYSGFNPSALPLSLLQKNVNGEIKSIVQMGRTVDSHNRESLVMLATLAHKQKFMPIIRTTYCTHYCLEKKSAFIPVTIILQDNPDIKYSFEEQLEQKINDFHNSEPLFNSFTNQKLLSSQALKQRKIECKKDSNNNITLEHGNRGGYNKRKFHDFLREKGTDGTNTLALANRQLGNVGIKRRRLLPPTEQKTSETISLTESLSLS